MKRLLLLIFTLILGTLLIACNANSNNDSNDADTDADTNEQGSEVSGEIAITHELDSEEVIVPINPQKIVVFDFSTLDTLDYLGLGDRVVGFPKANVPNYLSDYDSDQYENLGSLKEPDFEKIHSLQPDLIIISTRQAELYDQFKEIAPTVYIALDTNNYLESFDQNTKTIGEIFDKTEEVETALTELHEKLNSIKENVATNDEKALIVLGTEGKVSAFGPGSRFGFIHDEFGFTAADENLEISQHGHSITFEYILETNPDIIFIIDRDAAIGMESSVQDSFENDLVQKTNAYNNDKLIYLDGEVWYLAGGGITSFDLIIDEIADSLD